MVALPDSGLMSRLEIVPDPRKKRGRQFEWSFLLVIITAALASGQKSVRAIVHWAVLHAKELLALLQPRASRVLPPCIAPCARWTLKRSRARLRLMGWQSIRPTR